MTFCMAWKSLRSVFLVADSAITGALPLRESTSSFGELHVKADFNVAQGALKIIPMGRAAFTFAGTVPVGYAVADAIMGRAAVDGNAGRAFQQAINSVYPLKSGEGIQAIFAISDTAGRPHILTCDSNDGPGIRIVDRAVRYGSLEGELQKQAEDVAMELARESGVGDGAVLASVIAFLQSMTVHNPLMEQGVGGHFTGAVLAPEGSAWNPDMIYGLYDSSRMNEPIRSIGNLVRGHVACIPSSVTHDTRCFTRSFRPGELEAWKSKWLDEVSGFLRQGRCAYFVFLDTLHHRVTMVEMAGHKEHELLKLESGAVLMAPELVGVLTDGMEDLRTKMKFIPYKAPVS